MKHRSIHIFILVAAALVAAPRATQELSALKDAASRRVKAEIFNAFLNLQSGDAGRRVAPSADQSLASSETCAGGESKPAARPRTSMQVEVHARREVPADVAMLGEPVVPEVAALAPAPPPAPEVVVPAYVFEAEVEELPAEVAMLGAPEDDVTRPRPAGRREVAKRAAPRKKRAAEWKIEEASVVVRFDGDEVRLPGLNEADVLSQLDALRQLGVALDVAPRPRAKAFRVRRPPVPAPAARPVPVARQACPGRQAGQVACWPVEPAMYFAGE